ncbi:3'-5' exonuclease domain-containing protein 2, partial [Xanthomonas citri pv. citri]|nr:3'-5' exonuclease domain-containing protein 2 [Xanthomonas citri pv. citri]
SKGQRLSNWEADHLTENQQLYAATDAWSCIKIYEVLKSGKFKSPIYKIQPSSL